MGYSVDVKDSVECVNLDYVDWSRMMFDAGLGDFRKSGHQTDMGLLEFTLLILVSGHVDFPYFRT